MRWYWYTVRCVNLDMLWQFTPKFKVTQLTAKWKYWKAKKRPTGAMHFSPDHQHNVDQMYFCYSLSLSLRLLYSEETVVRKGLDIYPAVLFLLPAPVLKQFYCLAGTAMSSKREGLSKGRDIVYLSVQCSSARLVRCSPRYFKLVSL